jgi:hypothetical protein
MSLKIENSRRVAESRPVCMDLYSRTRITAKTVHHIMEDNFALRYVLKHPGVNSRVELVPSHGASRRRLGD